MDEFSALAHRVAGGVADVRGCLILSREGMIVGSYPDDEGVAKPAWIRFAALGEPERGFVRFPDQTWVYVHRGPYAAFAVAASSVRPGLLMDQLEQALLIAEEFRTRREAVRIPEPPLAPTGKPRVPLHPAAERAPTEVSPGRATADVARPAARDHEGPSGEARPRKRKEGGDVRPGAGSSPAADADDRPPRGAEDRRPAPARQTSFEVDDEAEVDRVLLAKEFSGLLQVDGGDDEGRS